MTRCLQTLAKNPFLFLLHQMMSNISNQVDILPGEEFRTAMKASKQLDPLPRFILGDRALKVTLERCWCALSTWAKLTFARNLVWDSLMETVTKDDIEKMKDAGELERMMAELAATVPAD